MSYYLILCTCPESHANPLATQLVTAKLAGCVNIVPAIQSIYCWQDKLEHSTEQLLLIKTTEANYAAIEAMIQSLHPYQVPEIIAIPIAAGAANYLEWLHTGCRENTPC